MALGGWLGPLTIVVAVALGGLLLRALDRFDTREVDGRAPAPPRPLPRSCMSRWELIARGVAENARAGWESGSTRRWR